MGNGNVIVSSIKHTKIKGMLVVFSKAKRKLQILPLEQYEQNPIDRKDIGRDIFQIFFPTKESLERLIRHLQEMYDDWEKQE